MGIDTDLTNETLAAAMPGRALRCYPALLSTEADALAWARGGAPDGAVVAAGYQASPRGRAGLEWRMDPTSDLGFSLVLHPNLPPEREGWMYTVAASGLADVVGEAATIEWPDEVRVGGERAGAVGVYVELGPETTEWAVVNVLVIAAQPSPAELMARIVAAIESRHRSTPSDVLGDYLSRCETLGRSVRARMIPLGPSGPQVTGKAVGALMDGALLIETEDGRRIAVRPQNLGLLEDA